MTKPVMTPPEQPYYDADTPVECREHGHDWATTGVYDAGALCIPCKRQGCAAELRQYPDGRAAIKPTGFETTVNGIALDIEDDPAGGVAKIICREIAESYDLDALDLKPDDVVLDIGAQVGIVSIYLAKRYPGIRVIAYEPVVQNFKRLERNVAANGVKVVAVNKAVTADGRLLALHGDLHQNSGGVSAFTQQSAGSAFLDRATDPKDWTSSPLHLASSVTLAGIFEVYQFERVALLKIDCEGAEYEILQAAPELLDSVEHLRGEFHVNGRLRALGCDPDALLTMVKQHVADAQAHTCQIAE